MASFCASETAEAGRIATGCEQGDHVSRRKGAKAREACGPDRGKLSACQKVLQRGRFYVLFASTKRTKSSRRAAALSTPGKRFKTLRNIFFVTFPALVPKPVYGATLFFGGFEPVRKGSCSADARPLFFENGIPHCKLTGASRIRKGQLHVIFVAVVI